MFEIDAIIGWLQGLSPLGIYAALWVTTFIENVFPPSPSDVVMLFIATLIGLGTISFIPALVIATTGSVAGFLTAFYLGRRFGRTITKSNRFPFLTQSSLTKVDAWFDKYGYGVIVANRFLAGTRAVVSFFAGMSELKPVKTTILCTISALLWNGLILGLGTLVGENWEKGAEILRSYGLVVTCIIVAVALFFAGRWLYRRNRSKSQTPS